MNQALKTFKPYLKAFGTGPKGNRELTFAEAKEACQLILDQKIPREVVGAFLISWRVQAESVEEMLGALEALKESENTLEPLTNSIEVAFPMEGKKKNIPLLILTAALLPHEHFVITSSPSAKMQGAVSLLDLKQVLPTNITLVDRSLHLPKLEALQTLRDNLGLRTVFNTLEKLHHPLKSDYAVVGAHHGPYFKKYASIFSHQYKRMMILQGDEGCGEIIKKGKIEIIENGEVLESFTLDPKEFDINFVKPTEACSLNEMKNILKNPSSELIKLAKLNAAVYLYMKDSSLSLQNIFQTL